MSTKKDYFIRALEFAEKNPKGFTLADIKAGAGLTDEEERNLQHQIGQGDVFKPLANYYIMTFEDRFRLLEYIELQEARTASNRAMWAGLLLR